MAQQLTPQQAKQMQTVVRQAMQVLLDEATAKGIVAKARSARPEQAIADATAPVLKRVYEVATEAGVQIEMPILLAAGIVIMGELAEMLMSDGVITEQQIPAVIAAASKIAVDQHNAQFQGQPAQPEQPSNMMGT